MPEDENKPRELIDKLKLPPGEAETNRGGNQRGKDCPACGAKGAKEPGLTHCAYCGHEFLTRTKK